MGILFAFYFYVQRFPCSLYKQQPHMLQPPSRFQHGVECQTGLTHLSFVQDGAFKLKTRLASVWPWSGLRPTSGARQVPSINAYLTCIQGLSIPAIYHEYG